MMADAVCVCLCAKDEVVNVSGLKSELQLIEAALKDVQVVLLDAQEHRFTNDKIRAWVQDFRDIATDIEDVLDDISTQRLKCGASSSSTKSAYNKIKEYFSIYKVSHQVKDIRERLLEVKTQNPSRPDGNVALATSVDVLTSERGITKASSATTTTELVGRNSDLASIREHLLANGKDVCVIAITGMSGIGKTSVAEHVYRSDEIFQNFDRRFWVHVAEKYELQTLMANLQQDLTEIQQQNQSVLLVLDNFAPKKEDDWTNLKNLLRPFSSKSKILATTSQEVLLEGDNDQVHALHRLSDEESYEILVQQAGCSTDASLCKVADSIAKMCYGIPLLAQVIGGVLKHESDLELWFQISKSELLAIKDGPQKIFSALKLSYIKLPEPLQHCLTALCALHKRGHPIFRTELINKWMALGLLESSKGDRDMEALGDEHIKKLLSMGYFQFPGRHTVEKVIKEYGRVFMGTSGLWGQLQHGFDEPDINLESLLDKFFEVKRLFFVEVHDLVHGLAQHVLGSEFYAVTADTREIPERAKYVVWKHRDLTTFPVSFGKLRARSFSFDLPSSGTPLNKPLLSPRFLKSLISSLSFVRVLDLSYVEFVELPNSVGKLKRLRYLTVCGNAKLKKLPKKLKGLVNLQTLDLFDCKNLEDFPKKMEQLLSLRFLVLTTSQSCLPRSLLGVKNLRTLRIALCERLVSLDGIGSLINLRKLEIISCGISSLPNDIAALEELEEFNLFNCRKLGLEGWEGVPPKLTFLSLQEMPEVHTLPNSIRNAKECLSVLRIHSCVELETLGQGIEECTSLVQVSVINCPKLVPPSGANWGAIPEKIIE